MIYLGIDWAEAHHDACVMDEAGQVLAKGRVPEGVEGLEKLHEMVGAHADDPSQVIVGIETDRGLMVQALIASVMASMRSTRSQPRATGTAIRSQGPSPNPGDAKMLGNRWVGILHGCLAHHALYDENVAWPGQEEAAA